MSIKRRQIEVVVPKFPRYIQEFGLPDTPQAQALMDYALTAGLAIEECKDVYEGEKSRKPNFRQIMRTVASIHGVPPEEMITQWFWVDHVLSMLKVPPILDAKARMGGQIIIGVKH